LLPLVVNLLWIPCGRSGQSLQDLVGRLCVLRLR
jgi:hypothetical protein